jgi:hypothetical protein
VIEPPDQVQCREGFFRMALFAIGAKLVFVHVFVATVTVGRFNTGKALEFLAVPGLFLVAFDTIRLNVFSFERKVGCIVIEIRSRTESLCVMTFCAVVGSEGVLVIIFMAGSAILAEAEVGFLFGSQLSVLNKIRDMALAAIDRLVCASELVSGQVVVEIIFLKADHVEIPAMVIVVAACAAFPLHFGRGMVARSLIDPAFYFLMAGEAFGVVDLFPQGMTLGAVANAFEFGMCA